MSLPGMVIQIVFMLGKQQLFPLQNRILVLAIIMCINFILARMKNQK